MTALDVLDGSSGRALSINDFGQVVGRYQSGGSTRPFLWENGEAVDLTARLAPGEDWTIHTADDINQAGVIVGTGSPNGGVTRAIALVPFPGNLSLADAQIDILKLLTSTGSNLNKP
jgi:probable HAF family extracellular repeat protein